MSKVGKIDEVLFMSSENRMTMDDLKTMQSWSLERKVRVAQLRIQETLIHSDGNAVINFSGGKDSTVLLDLARRVEPTIKAVYVDTGIEFPEVLKFVNLQHNVDIIKPQLCGEKCIGDGCKTRCFGRIVKEVGWNFPSKDVSLTIEYARKGSKWAVERFDGVDKNGEVSKFRQRYKKYKYLLDAPFLISSSCCNLLKEKPLNNYHKAAHSIPIIGTMASESNRRRESWLRTGCNAFDIDKPVSKPISFWTEQDILQYIKQTKLPIAECYGEIVEDVNGLLRTTCESRTGCCLCPVNCHREKENKYIRLQQSHPELWEYAMECGIKDVLDYIGVSYKVPKKSKPLF
jgi:3'-phosphoadenosine 5'-phosphosulfate sulfotransferase (PAPS reductase)/FAD synthetase